VWWLIVLFCFLLMYSHPLTPTHQHHHHHHQHHHQQVFVIRPPPPYHEHEPSVKEVTIAAPSKSNPQVKAACGFVDGSIDWHK
jgi:hypothetical protein